MRIADQAGTRQTRAQIVEDNLRDVDGMRFNGDGSC